MYVRIYIYIYIDITHTHTHTSSDSPGDQIKGQVGGILVLTGGRVYQPEVGEGDLGPQGAKARPISGPEPFWWGLSYSEPCVVEFRVGLHKIYTCIISMLECMFALQ